MIKIIVPSRQKKGGGGESKNADLENLNNENVSTNRKRELIWKKEFETERRFWIICGLN
jgi:hypothetical protein